MDANAAAALITRLTGQSCAANTCQALVAAGDREEFLDLLARHPAIAYARSRYSLARQKRCVRHGIRRGDMRLFIGAEMLRFPGWTGVNANLIDVTDGACWAAAVPPESVAMILMHHAWADCPAADTPRVARHAFGALRPGGRARIAVLPDQSASGNDGANVHTADSVSEALARAGFRVIVRQWTDEHGKRHRTFWSRETGRPPPAAPLDALVVDGFKPRREDEPVTVVVGGAAGPVVGAINIPLREFAGIPAGVVKREHLPFDWADQVLLAPDAVDPPIEPQTIRAVLTILRPGGRLRFAVSPSSCEPLAAIAAEIETTGATITGLDEASAPRVVEAVSPS